MRKKQPQNYLSTWSDLGRNKRTKHTRTIWSVLSDHILKIGNLMYKILNLI